MNDQKKPHVPTDAEMKRAHDGVEPWCDTDAEWDAWLAAHDAEVRAEERAKRLDVEALERAILAGFGAVARSELAGELPRVTPMEGIRDAVLALGREAREEPTAEAWQELVSAERARQVAIGYDEKHDSEHGIGHLLRWADDYLRQGEVIKGAALVKAARTLDEIEARRARKAREEPHADEWCREESCRYRHWRSGSMPTHKRGKECPEVSRG